MDTLIVSLSDMHSGSTKALFLPRMVQFEHTNYTPTPNQKQIYKHWMKCAEWVREHYPIDLPDPVSAIEFRMEQMGMTRKDLGKFIGSPEEMVMDAETEADKTADGRLKIDSILEVCSGLPELEDIVYAIIAGQCDAKPRNLAEFLGRPVEEIYQNLRTLRRRADKIRMEAQNGRR